MSANRCYVCRKFFIVHERTVDVPFRLGSKVHAACQNKLSSQAQSTPILKNNYVYSTTSKQSDISPSSSANLNESLNCPICFELMERAMVLFPCGHSLCESDCTQILHSHKKECPTCRVTVTSHARNYAVESAVTNYKKSVEEMDLNNIRRLENESHQNTSMAIKSSAQTTIELDNASLTQNFVVLSDKLIVEFMNQTGAAREEAGFFIDAACDGEDLKYEQVLELALSSYYDVQS